MTKKTMRVDGMTCAMCAKTIENTFADQEGVTAKVNVGAGKVIFNYDEAQYSFVDLANMVEAVGYEPVLEESLDDNKKYRKKLRIEIYIAVIFSIPLLWAMFSHIPGFEFVYVPAILTNGIFQLIVSGVVQFYIGKRFYIAAYKSLKKKVLGMDSLVVMGTTSAYLYSMYLLYEQLFVNPSMHPMYYFEISALIITMVLVGNYIEHIAKERTTDALVELVNLGAKEARVIRNDKEQMVGIDEVYLGDKVVVLANEKIPVDGKIIKGSTYIDESMITGESIPVLKDENSDVIGATINLREKIVIEATKVGANTMLAQIIQTVEDAASEKPPIQRTADKIAAYFVPMVVSIAIINFIVQFGLLGYTFETAFTRTVAILVISCPCALGLATPTSILVGNGKAAQNHILYKGGEFFELANKIEAIAFDKTGTLTNGEPIVTDYLGDESVQEMVYAIEKESTHPISQAFIEFYEKHHSKGTDLEISQYDTIKGKGIKATVNNKKIHIGSTKMVTDLSLDNPFEAESLTLLNQAKTVNFIIVDDKVVALYGVRDEIKDTSKDVINEMKKRGLTPYMITGDNQHVANAIAKELGIEHVYSEVLPHEKADIVKEIKATGKITAFVGDGINDAPALKLADVGIAMGHGTDVAIDSSDVTLMSYDLGLVIKAIDMSKATLKNIYQNFGWAFSYNVIAIPLAAAGYLSMALAAAAMAFSSITVVLNALRLKRYKLPEFEKDNIEERGQNMKLTVSNMTCNYCKMTITNALKAEGINDINIDLDNKIVELDPVDKTLEDIKKIIEDKGYDVEG